MWQCTHILDSLEVNIFLSSRTLRTIESDKDCWYTGCYWVHLSGTGCQWDILVPYISLLQDPSVSASVMSLLAVKWELEDLGDFAGHRSYRQKDLSLRCCVRKGEAGAETAAEQAGHSSHQHSPSASQQREQGRSRDSSWLQPRAKTGRQVSSDEAALKSSQEAKSARQGQNSHQGGIWAGIAEKLLWQGPRLLCNMLNRSCQNTQGERNQIYYVLLVSFW